MATVERRNEIVFVLGMHRSGTSAVAESLVAMGYAVPGRMLETDVHVNERGFWESQDVVELNELMLSSMGRSWFDVFLPELGWYKQPGFSPIKKKIKSFVGKALKQYGSLVIKDPRLCLLLPLWCDALATSECVIRVLSVGRNPIAVAKSLEKRDGFPLSVGELLWNAYSIAAMSACAGLSALSLDYETLLSDERTRLSVGQFLEKKPLSTKVWRGVFSSGLKHHAGGSAWVWQDWSAQVMQVWPHGKVMAPPILNAVQALSTSFSHWLKENEEWVSGMNVASHAVVASRQELMRVGQLHHHALEVIADKDAQIDACIGDVNACHRYLSAAETSALKVPELELALAQQGNVVSSLEQDLAGHAEYIRRLSVRIAELDEQLSGVGTVKEQVDHLSQVVADRDGKITDLQAYIAQCESRLAELHMALGEFESVRARLAEVESTLQQRDADVVSNAVYIAQCESRLAELHTALDEFESVRARLAEVESTLQQRDADVASNAVYIAQCESRLAELHAALDEFESVRARLGEVELALQQRDADVASNAAYIAQCEGRLAELHAALDEFESVRARLAEVESTLQQRDADVVSNAAYIAQCESRLAELHTALDEFESVRSRLAEVESTLQQRDADVVSNAAYIAQCDSRLAELHTALDEFESVRSRLAEVESTLQQRDVDVANNAAYIAQCESRLAELHTALNQFESVRARLAEVESTLQQRDADVASNTEYIAKCAEYIAVLEGELQQRNAGLEQSHQKVVDCETKIGELELAWSVTKQELSVTKQELDKHQGQLNHLLSWRVVRWINRYINRDIPKND